MNQILHKIFLDTLLDSTLHNPSSRSFAFDWERIAGNRFETEGDFNDLNGYTGTDQDDTVHIAGNVTTDNAEHSTLIALEDGDDTVNIDGKILLQEGGNVSINGHGSKNSITVAGIEAYGHKDNVFGFIDFSLLGSDTNTLHVAGNITSRGISEGYAPLIHIIMQSETPGTLSNNYFLIDGDTSFDSGRDSYIELDGYENQYSIQGNFTLNDYSCFYASLSGVYNDFTIGDSLIFKNSSAQITLENLYTLTSEETVYSTFKIANQIHVSHDGMLDVIVGGNVADIEIGSIFSEQQGSHVHIITSQTYDHENISRSTTTINGNIEAINGGQITFTLDSNFNTLEVKGQVISRYDNITDLNTLNNYDSDIGFYSGESSSSAYNFLGGMFNNNGFISVKTGSGNDLVSITGNVDAESNLFGTGGINNFYLGSGDNTFTLVGDLIAGTHSSNSISADEGKNTFSIKGNVSAQGDGTNELRGGLGDDTFILNGHIASGALDISGNDGNDTLVLTANSNNNFEANYKDWLTDFSSTGSLVKCDIETIRLDVDRLQIAKLSWFTDIINKANADGAHITVENQIGRQLINPTTYLAQGNDTHNPINDVLDHYAPAAANVAQPKAFAEHVAAPSADTFTAPHFDDNNFLHEMEQQAQVHAAAVA